jgi:hypothetical protein
MEKTLGEIGYEKWRSLLPAHATAGLPAWDRLPESAKAGWEDVAVAVVNQYETKFIR